METPLEPADVSQMIMTLLISEKGVYDEKLQLRKSKGYPFVKWNDPENLEKTNGGK